MPRVLYLTSSVLYSAISSLVISINNNNKGYHVVIPLLLHRYQYCICKSSMLNTTCATITLHSLCLLLVLLFKYSYRAMHIWHLNWKWPSIIYTH